MYNIDTNIICNRDADAKLPHCGGFSLAAELIERLLKRAAGVLLEIKAVATLVCAGSISDSSTASTEEFCIAYTSVQLPAVRWRWRPIDESALAAGRFRGLALAAHACIPCRGFGSRGKSSPILKARPSSSPTVIASHSQGKPSNKRCS